MSIAMTTSVEVLEIRGEGLVLSRIIARRYRRYIPHYLERIYDLNPGLAAQGPILTVGTKIKFPAPMSAEDTNAIDIVRLWD